MRARTAAVQLASLYTVPAEWLWGTAEEPSVETMGVDEPMPLAEPALSLDVEPPAGPFL